MSYMIVELIQYFFFQMVKFTHILKQFSKSSSKFFTHLEFRFSHDHSSKIHVENKSHDSQLSKTQNLSLTTKNTIHHHDRTLQGNEVELLMANLGVFCHPGDQKLPEVLHATDLLDIFEVDQPRLDEVKEAFDVFDENKDGLIDESELQRVLCALGLNERAELEDCKKMIRAFDVNADGRIDFDEFVKFMEETTY
uniref:probable calcium-binding protein CML45 n=1 Tax=Erigeron canadensis TaxID=72917 RepID=UPI001CB99D71|nr:probable calcium-binding protein CML45 [Erigeron canadensis]